MEKQITLNSGITCSWLEIYNVNLQTEEIEIAIYYNETAFNNSNGPVTSRTIKAEGIFTEEELQKEGNSPKKIAETFLQNYDFSV